MYIYIYKWRSKNDISFIILFSSCYYFFCSSSSIVQKYHYKTVKRKIKINEKHENDFMLLTICEYVINSV